MQNIFQKFSNGNNEKKKYFLNQILTSDLQTNDYERFILLIGYWNFYNISIEINKAEIKKKKKIKF